MSIRHAARGARSSTVQAPESIVTVREATVSKLSPRAKGCLTYGVGLGASGMCYLAVTANAGGGYFSREWVSLASLRACLADFLDGAECFPTSLLQAVYANRSVNNACFLVAILRHEGLLIAGDPPNLHRCSGDWEGWEHAQGVETTGVVDEDAATSHSAETEAGETESGTVADEILVSEPESESEPEPEPELESESESIPEVERVLAVPEPRKGRRAGRH